jgi:arsenate reductase
MVLYGIPNCNTVKSARVWLDARGIDYRFHDFKKQGIDTARLGQWADTLGLDTLINRRGLTWRGLSDAEKALAGQRDSALGLLASKPSLIKRPVLEGPHGLHAGFNEMDYTQIFGDPA